MIELTRSLAREVGGYGITANVVTPGVTLTKAVRNSFTSEMIEEQHKSRALQRDEEAEDFVGPVFFLASPDADFISGQIVNIEGGNFMH